MQNPNHFSGIVKILENPKQKIIKNKIKRLEFRALLAPTRLNKSSKIISLIFWGSLKKDLKDLYKTNDYILIEGYVAIKINRKRNTKIFNSKKIAIVVLKAYPYGFKLHDRIK